MWSLIRLTSLNWCYIKTHRHTHAYTQADQVLPQLRQPDPPEWSMSLSSRYCVQGPGQGRGAAAARHRADISGHGVSDVSLLLPWGCRGGRGSGSAQSSRPGERSPLGLVWLIGQEAVSTVPLSILVATSFPNCICSSNQASSAHGGRKIIKCGCSDTQE